MTFKAQRNETVKKHRKEKLFIDSVVSKCCVYNKSAKLNPTTVHMLGTIDGVIGVVFQTY